MRIMGLPWRYLLFLTLPLYVADQVTKALVLSRIEMDDSYAG